MNFSAQLVSDALHGCAVVLLGTRSDGDVTFDLCLPDRNRGVLGTIEAVRMAVISRALRLTGTGRASEQDREALYRRLVRSPAEVIEPIADLPVPRPRAKSARTLSDISGKMLRPDLNAIVAIAAGGTGKLNKTEYGCAGSCRSIADFLDLLERGKWAISLQHIGIGNSRADH